MIRPQPLMKRRLNGWQRLWIVSTILFWLVAAVGVPWAYVSKYTHYWDDRLEYKWKLQQEYKSGVCSRYITQPISTLSEPELQSYSDGRLDRAKCWYIYASREKDVGDFGDTIPYTLEVYEGNIKTRKWRQYLFRFELVSAATPILWGLIYLFGLVIAWIRRGF